METDDSGFSDGAHDVGRAAPDGEEEDTLCLTWDHFTHEGTFICEEKEYLSHEIRRKNVILWPWWNFLKPMINTINHTVIIVNQYQYICGVLQYHSFFNIVIYYIVA